METLYCGGGCSIGHELCLKGVKQMKRRDYTDAVINGLRHVTKAEKENDTLTVHIKQTQDGMTCDMAAWHFLIELDKKYDTNEVSIIEK